MRTKTSIYSGLKRGLKLNLERDESAVRPLEKERKKQASTEKKGPKLNVRDGRNSTLARGA